MTLKERAARLVAPYGSTRSVLAGPARGMRFVVELGIGATYALGVAEAAPRHFARWIRPGMTVYDVGANKGQMALLFAALVGPSGRVASFEPAPVEYVSLMRNVALNGLDQVTTYEAAAAAKAGSIIFRYDPAAPTTGKVSGVEQPVPRAGTIEMSVPTLALDIVIAQVGMPHVIKIDVEGAAAEVLRGAQRILDEGAPAIYVENHTMSEQEGVEIQLVSRGYHIEVPEGGVPVNEKGLQAARWYFRD